MWIIKMIRFTYLRCRIRNFSHYFLKCGRFFGLLLIVQCNFFTKFSWIRHADVFFFYGKSNFCLFSPTSPSISVSSIGNSFFCFICFFFFSFYFFFFFNSIQRVGKKVDEHRTNNNRKKKIFRFFDSLVQTLYNNFLSVFLPLSCLFSMFFSYLHTSTERSYNTCVHNVITVRKLFCDVTLQMKKKN